MTLIKDMLKNLEGKKNKNKPSVEAKQQPSQENKPQQETKLQSYSKEPALQTAPTYHEEPKTKATASWHPYNTISIMIGVAILVLLAIFFMISSSHFQSTKASLYSSFKNATSALKFKSSPSLASVTPRRSFSASPAKQQYFAAINQLNQGNIKQALQELRVIMDKYPQFEPAKKTYQQLTGKQAKALTS